MQDDFEGDEVWGIPYPEAGVPLFGLDRDRLDRLYGQAPLDFLHTARSVWGQAPLSPENAMPPMLAKGFRPSPDSVQQDLADISALLDDLPPDLSPVIDWPAMQARGLGITAEASEPRVRKLLSYWDLIFGGYHENPPHPDESVPIYIPIFDYHAEKSIEKALTAKVDATLEAETETKVDLKVKSVGLTGSAKLKVKHALDGATRNETFQVVIPVSMVLTRYHHPVTRDVRYTARAADPSGPTTAVPADSGKYLPLARPGGLSHPVEFLNSGGEPEPTTEEIERGASLSAEFPLPAPGGITLGIGFTARIAQTLKVTFTKTQGRTERLIGRKYDDLKIRFDVEELRD